MIDSIAGVIWLLIIAAAVIALAKNGPAGLKAWAKAKFIGTGS